MSKSLATITTQPLIVAKVGLQSKPPPAREGKPSKSFIEVMQFIITHEGPLGLFKGIGPQILKGLLVQGLLMMTKERCVFHSSCHCHASVANRLQSRAAVCPLHPLSAEAPVQPPGPVRRSRQARPPEHQIIVSETRKRRTTEKRADRDLCFCINSEGFSQSVILFSCVTFASSCPFLASAFPLFCAIFRNTNADNVHKVVLVPNRPAKPDWRRAVRPGERLSIAGCCRQHAPLFPLARLMME